MTHAVSFSCPNAVNEERKIKEKENAFMKNRSQNFGDRFSFQRINKQEFLAINVENFEISAHFSADKKKVFYSSFRAEN